MVEGMNGMYLMISKRGSVLASHQFQASSLAFLTFDMSVKR